MALTFFPLVHFRIEGPSMQKKYKHGQSVFVNKLAYLLHSPKQGDVVVLWHPFKKNTRIMKRIAAGPGTQVQLQWGRLFFDNDRVGDIHYTDIFFDEQGTRRKRWHVPKNNYFVLGDNPPQSSDSRHFGTIHKNLIVGKVLTK